MNSVEFVEQLKEFQSKLNINDNLCKYIGVQDFIFYEIDHAHCNGEFKEVDKIFDFIEMNQFHWWILYSIVVITYHAKDRLKNRDLFYDLVEKFIIDNNFFKGKNNHICKWK